jgi:hypothetical protein
MSQPRVDLPEFPTGYLPGPVGSHLGWIDVEQGLIDALHYWLATTRPDGRPHVMPRWGVWLDGEFWYDGSPQTRHVRNLVENNRCVLHLESGQTVTIVEGRSAAASAVDGDLGDRLAGEFARKYAPTYAPSPDSWSGADAGGLRVLTPEKVIAWTAFPTDVTRFTF